MAGKRATGATAAADCASVDSGINGTAGVNLRYVMLLERFEILYHAITSMIASNSP